MMYTKEQVINGITGYVDGEVIPKLPTAGKWIMGTAVAMALKSGSDIINKNADTLRMIGAMNSDGMIDVDKVAPVLKEQAARYGVIQIDLPVIGAMTFSDHDIDLLRGYIK